MYSRRPLERSPSVLLARDIMRRDPLSIDEAATIREAARFLTSKNIGAAPVINGAGRPLGVVSRSDIVRKARVCEENYLDLTSIPVRDIMTPSLRLVKEETPVAQVIDELLDYDVRRMFVADSDGVLIGVVSATDILTSLRDLPTPHHDESCACAT